MPINPQLNHDINELKRKGYEIEIKNVDGSEMGIILKNYEIPGNIWNLQKIDLLIVTHNTYPNAKMDMFWVRPSLFLKNGNLPEAVSEISKFDMQWQQFSWHTPTWNPAKDNINTHLQVVATRLGMNK